MYLEVHVKVDYHLIKVRVAPIIICKLNKVRYCTIDLVYTITLYLFYGSIYNKYIITLVNKMSAEHSLLSNNSYGYYDNSYTSEFLISFEAWAKLAQKWLVSAPLGIHLEPINKELMLLVTI